MKEPIPESRLEDICKKADKPQVISLGIEDFEALVEEARSYRYLLKTIRINAMTLRDRAMGNKSPHDKIARTLEELLPVSWKFDIEGKQ